MLQTSDQHNHLHQCGPLEIQAQVRGVNKPALLCHKDTTAQVHDVLIGPASFGCIGALKRELLSASHLISEPPVDQTVSDIFSI